MPRLVLARAVAAWRRHRARQQERRILAAMLRLDDRLLRDLGLTRGDVIWAANLPPGESPTRRLAQAAARRPRRP
jgi:uncharacterized protein YjiS (DUF1127 family)